ncbi:MAG: glycosyltransferase [Chthoniobacterales bacterium]
MAHLRSSKDLAHNFVIDLSVILPTHNPHAGRLQRTLEGLKQQSLPSQKWETVIVDNASSSPLKVTDFADSAPQNLKIVLESTLGLTAARRCGILETAAPIIVFVDDDNILAPDYLENVLHHFVENPKIGAIGGRSLPEFEKEPEPWIREFDGLLALRDPGDTAQFSGPLRDQKTEKIAYPFCAPVGAGMALRREGLSKWLETFDTNKFSDRKGDKLTSSGDNDLILHLMQSGWEVAYFPDLGLTHLIPAGRTTLDYLSRLNEGIQESWMRLLTRHQMNPWPPISRWSMPLRKMKSWFTFRAWESPAAYVRWRGTCGHFTGRV